MQETQAMVPPKPHWEHDCEHCRLVSVITDQDGVIYDVYTHDYGDGSVGTVARFGDDGPEYLSGTPSTWITLGGTPTLLGPFFTDSL